MPEPAPPKAGDVDGSACSSCGIGLVRGVEASYRRRMAEDLAPSPWSFEVAQPALRAELPPEHVALAFDRGPDPIDCGFLLAGGVLAPLPAKVRLPHDEDDGTDLD